MNASRPDVSLDLGTLFDMLPQMEWRASGAIREAAISFAGPRDELIQ
jgi:hypothetical protein